MSFKKMSFKNNYDYVIYQPHNEQAPLPLLKHQVFWLYKFIAKHTHNGEKFGHPFCSAGDIWKAF